MMRLYVSGNAYVAVGSMRFGQPPAMLMPSICITMREPPMPRIIGSPPMPPLRTTENPGMDFR